MVFSPTLLARFEIEISHGWMFFFLAFVFILLNRDFHKLILFISHNLESLAS